MFRSVTMDYYSIFFNKEYSLEILGELAQLGVIQFEDLHHDKLEPQKNYFSQLQEIQKNLDIISNFKTIALNENFNDFQFNIDQHEISIILSKIRQTFQQKNSDQFYHEVFENLEQKFQTLQEAQKDKDLIKDKLIENSDYLNILKSLQDFLPKNFMKQKSFDDQFQEGNQFSIFQQVGVISQSRLFNFQKALFRITRGNAYQKYFKITQPYYDKNKIKCQEKVIIYISCQRNSNNSYIVERVQKLIESFEIKTFLIPENQVEIQNEINKNQNDQIEMCTIFNKSLDKLERHLEEIFSLNRQNYSFYHEIKIQLMRQKQIYENLNKMIFTENFIEGRIWVPSDQNQYLREAVSVLDKKKEFINFRLTLLDYKLQNKKPPTQIQTNQFTKPFQDIIDTYGLPQYKEINPGLFTIVTFPFLFGVMFGDIGHGLGVFFFALFLFIKKDSFPKALIDLRSLLIFMGFFATFCGLIYNDFLAIPFPLTDSCYIDYQGESQRKVDCVYPVGLDPVWHHEISFINSMKMKMSIIIGVVHMLFGILMKGLNSLYFKKYSDFIFDFIPQIIFMCTTFGYMCFCIILKWFKDYSGNPSEAPSIISLFINFVQKVDFPLFENQLLIQKTLAIITVICVPILFLGKPIVFLMDSMATKKQRGYTKIKEPSIIDFENKQIDLKDEEITNNLTLNESILQEDSKEDHSFGEVFIHQAIETIEFVLGSISNTASYLRLWALSLAHSQLAKVFLDMILKPWIVGNSNPLLQGLITAIMFCMFFIVTVGVIMIMDFMECFLHALRLHWVEFQNKFYKGEGKKFDPVNFENYAKINFNNQQRFNQLQLLCFQKQNTPWQFQQEYLRIFLFMNCQVL